MVSFCDFLVKVADRKLQLHHPPVGIRIARRVIAKVVTTIPYEKTQNVNLYQDIPHAYSA